MSSQLIPCLLFTTTTNLKVVTQGPIFSEKEMTATASADALSDQVIDDVENVAATAATDPCCSDYQSDFESDYGLIQSEIDIENFGNDNM